MRKLLYKFEHPWQAEIFQGLLEQEGIQSFILKGAREYMTILTGIGQPPTDIYVEDLDLTGAQKILSDYLRKSQLQLVEEVSEAESPKKSKNHFNYVVFLSALGAVVVPAIFNIFATYHFMLLNRDKNISFFKKIVALAMLLLGWAATLFLSYNLIFKPVVSLIKAH